MRILATSMITMVVFAGGLFLTLHQPEMGGFSLSSALGIEEEPVIVFLVGQRSGVDLVRKVIDPERIVADTPDAIALAEGRIIAANQMAVAAPLTEAGWMDRRLELLVVPRDGERRRQKARSGEDTERLAQLMALMSKPSLTSGEQMFVLQAMNDGLGDF